MRFSLEVGDNPSIRKRGVPFLLKNVRRELHQNGTGYLLILPAGLLLLVMMFYPLETLIRMSLFSIEPLRHPQPVFVGATNYLKIFKDQDLIHSLIQTVIWTIGSIILQFGLGLTAALILNETFKGRGITRALLLIPWAMPSVAGALSWKWLYNAQYGLLNYLLTGLHLISQPINWVGSPSTAMLSAILTNTWRGYPFMMIMLLAGLQNISKEIYDAGAVDGANFRQQLRYLTLPLLKPVIFVVTLLSGIWTFNNFTYIYILTGGGPAGLTEILVTYVYKNGFSFFHFGYAAALSIFLFVIVLVLSLGYIRIMSRSGSLD